MLYFEITTILFFALFSGLQLSLKAYKQKDLSILGSSFSRLYLVFLCIVALTDVTISNTDFLLGVILIFITDLISSVVGFYTIKDRKDKCREFIKATEDVRTKLSLTLNSSLTPFFTISLCGDLEYVNESFSKLVGEDINCLPGKNINKVLGLEYNVVTHLLNDGKVNCDLNLGNKTVKAIIIGNKTVNGHETITGSIYTLGG